MCQGKGHSMSQFKGRLMAMARREGRRRASVSAMTMCE